MKKLFKPSTRWSEVDDDNKKISLKCFKQYYLLEWAVAFQISLKVNLKKD